MTTLPEEAVKAYIKAFGNTPRTKDMALKNEQKVRHAITAALPFLSVQVAVKKLEWGELRYTEDYSFAQDAETSIGRYIATDNGWFLQGQSGWKSEDDIEAAKAAAQADFEARILSALEPTSARELALEEIIALCKDYAEDSQPDSEYRLACNDIIEALQERRALSSPDHIADAGKVEGDGWLPIESAPHNEKVLLSWKDCLGEWTFEVFEASWGWRTDTVSNVSTHGKATHWRPLPTPPEGAE